jgi:hypothetical protein
MLARGARLTKERELCCALFLRNLSQSMFHGSMDHRGVNRLRKNSVCVQIPLCRVTLTRKHLAGCSKSLSSKAAGDSKPEAYPQGYVEDFDEPRTMLADFFSILLVRSCWGRLRPC